MLKGLGHARLKRLADYHGLDEAKLGIVGIKRSASPDELNRDLIITANTDQVDLDTEIVVPDGADTSYYGERRANFLDHNYEFEMHVGSMRSFKRFPADGEQRAWVNRSHIFTGLKNPFADDLWTISQQAGIGSSIGYEEIEGSPPTKSDPIRYQKAAWITRKWRMLELSFTALPCNVGCHDHHEHSMDESKMGIFDDLITKGRKRGGIELRSAIAMGFPHVKKAQVLVPRLPKLISLPRPTPPVILLDRAG